MPGGAASLPVPVNRFSQPTGGRKSICLVEVEAEEAIVIGVIEPKGYLPKVIV